MTVDNSSRTLAFLSYILLVVGALFILFFRRQDEFAAYHARQSLLLVVGAVLAPIVWYVAAWLVMWIPGVGGALGLGLFSGVLGVYLALIYGWLRGLVGSLRAERNPIPLFGEWVRYLPL